jgi:hypothetical protein
LSGGSSPASRAVRFGDNRPLIGPTLRPLSHPKALTQFTLIETAKLNGVDPQAWLADVLRRIADHPASKLDELLPWNWMKPEHQAAAA